VKAAAAAIGSTGKLSASQQHLVERHVHLADRIARRLHRKTPAHVRPELGSIARHGLVMAAAVFDPGRTDPFENFASSMIRGHLLHELRRRAVVANDVLADDPGPDGASHEIGDAYADSMLARVTGDDSRRASLGPEAELAERRDGAYTSAALAVARAELAPRTRELLRLRYEEELGWRELAARLGVAESTARLEHRTCLARLERRLRGRRA